MFAAFFSDPHFWHRNIIEYAERPFESVEEMNDALIRNYNRVVRASDNVLWLGDCFFCGHDDAKRIMDQLNGTKTLILGNHDESETAMLRRGFHMVIPHTCRLDIAGHPVLACHYPYKSRKLSEEDRYDMRFMGRRPARVPGQILMHGHTHARHRRRDNEIHVGVDAWGQAPAPLAEVEALVRLIKGAG